MEPQLPRCPICYEIIDEPVVYPCHHEVCKLCFERSIETANLWCPLCRKRVSSWARKHSKDPVHTHRKNEIQKELATLSSDDLTLNETSCLPIHVLSEQGEIQREYIHELSKVQEERVEEEKRGEVEAQKLLLEEEAELQKRQWELEKESQLGYEAARLLEEEERRKEHEQLEEDRRMAELLTQEFLLQRIEYQMRQTDEDQKIAEKLNKEMQEIASPSPCKALPTKKSSKFKTPKRKTSVHPKCASPSQSPASRPITFWLKPTNQT